MTSRRSVTRRDPGASADAGDDLMHDDASLMIPPPGFKFIPRFETVCGKPGCFECFDIYCERCESKDRRIVELEMRNNDLVKYITQVQGRIFGRDRSSPGLPSRFVPQPGGVRPSMDLPGSTGWSAFGLRTPFSSDSRSFCVYSKSRALRSKYERFLRRNHNIRSCPPRCSRQ